MTGTSRDGRDATVRQVLEVLARLAPDRRLPRFDVTRPADPPMAWLGFSGRAEDTFTPEPESLVRPLTPALRALHRYDAVNPESTDLRLGWLWIAGTAEIDGAERHLCLPLVSRPLTINDPLGQAVGPAAGSWLRDERLWQRKVSIKGVGPWDLWPLAEDGAGLESSIEWGGGVLADDIAPELMSRLTNLRAWVDAVIAASRLPPVTEMLGPGTDPRTVARGRDAGLVAVTGFGAYADVPLDPGRPRDALRGWAMTPAVADTAFASLYAPRPDPPAETDPEAADSVDRLPPVPLTTAQAEVVYRSRTAGVTVVSGPPGTGKSHTAAAVALDAVARGESVLVATRSVTAAEVVAGLLDEMGGPTPVLFGGGRQAGALAAKLADGLGAVNTPIGRHRAVDADGRQRQIRAAVAGELDLVIDAQHWAEELLNLTTRSLAAPRLFETDDGCDPTEAQQLAHAIDRPRRLLAGWRRRRAEARFRSLVGADTATALAEVLEAVRVAALRDRAARARVGNEALDEQRWAALVEATAAHRKAWAEALAEEVTSRPGPDERREVAALATALRAGRAGRRAHLLGVDVATLTRALPLWVGTLDQIEGLLPPRAGEFDLVILDEASQIDQVSGAAALLRARRLVVVGDPRQLRFVSFLSDEAVSAAIAATDPATATPLPATGSEFPSTTPTVLLPVDRLDVRRMSAFDLAAGVAAVTFLDEHFRSVPHLIGFSAERFYGDRLTIATRHPANETRLAIVLQRVAGSRTDGVNQAEVDAALVSILDLARSHPSWSLGLISPYRAQVDALEAGLDRPEFENLVTSGRLKVGTVHGFQGRECDAVVASFGVEATASRSRAFLEDPNLFNVLVTRAREHLVALATAEDPPAGLFADYLRWAVTPPPAVAGCGGSGTASGQAQKWRNQLAEVIIDAGVVVRIDYPVGRWTVDLVVGDGVDAVAVATSVHPDGVDAHIARHLALDALGWTQIHAFRVRFDADPVPVAMDLIGRVRGRDPGGT